MGFFSNAHNFIIAGPKGDEAGTQSDPRDVANQALATAHAMMENAGRIQSQAASVLPGTSLQLSMQNQALLGSDRSGLEIQRALAGQDLTVNSGGSTFAGNMAGLSGDQKRDLDAQLTEMRRQLQERKDRKAQRTANGEGRFGRQSGQNHGANRGLPGRASQRLPPTASPMALPPTSSLMALPPTASPMASPPTASPMVLPPTASPMALPPASSPMALPSTSSSTMPPPTSGGFIGGPSPANFPGPPPDFNPNSPEFQQFLAFKKQMGGSSFLPPFSAMPSAPTGSFPPYANMPPPPPGFVPQLPMANPPNYGGMQSVIPPPSQPNYSAYNYRGPATDFAPASGYTISVEASTQPAARAEEAPKEDEQDEEAPKVNDAETSSLSTSQPALKSPGSKSDGSSNGSDAAAALSVPSKKKEKRRRSSPLRNLFSNPKQRV